MIKITGLPLADSDSDDDDIICTCNCPCFEKAKLFCRRAHNSDIHPITLRIKNNKTREAFEQFTRTEVLKNVKYISIFFIVTFVI